MLRLVFACVWAAGCQGSLYGVGTVAVWNGTESLVKVTVEGRTSEEFTLYSGTSQVLHEAVAGPYVVTIESPDRPPQVETFDLVKEVHEVINVGSASCFARVDATGNYQSGRPRYVVLGTYEAAPRLNLRDQIYVFPGEALPPTRSKHQDPFQQLTTVDCGLVHDKNAIAEALRTGR